MKEMQTLLIFIPHLRDVASVGGSIEQMRNLNAGDLTGVPTCVQNLLNFHGCFQGCQAENSCKSIIIAKK